VGEDAELAQLRQHRPVGVVHPVGDRGAARVDGHRVVVHRPQHVVLDDRPGTARFRRHADLDVTVEAGPTGGPDDRVENRKIHGGGPTRGVVVPGASGGRRAGRHRRAALVVVVENGAEVPTGIP
jgi:hypothetical protein